MTSLVVFPVVLACSAEADAGSSESAAEETAAVEQAADLQGVACAPMTSNMPVEGRASPYDSTLITVGGRSAKICYGRPSARGRTMIGGEAVPYGQLWRTGANEPTTLHLPFAAEIAGVRLEPGSYSLYTMPGLEQWVVILNRSITQWGHEGRYTAEVRAQEVGRGTAPSSSTPSHVEQFTIRSEPTADGASLILEWENTRVTIPVRAL
jgi:hypothetical protein